MMNAQVWGLSPDVVTRTCPLRLWGRLRGHPATIRGAVMKGVTRAHGATRHCPEPGVRGGALPTTNSGSGQVGGSESRVQEETAACALDPSPGSDPRGPHPSYSR